MDIRLAPMEGVTDAVHRRVHHRLFGGVQQYYIPFITPSIHRVFTTRDLRAIAPENNAGVPCIPQLLTHDAKLFLWAAQELADLGYGEVNLNTGCPSGTVTAKGRGSGMLRDLDALRAFLDAIFAASPLPVSIKTRCPLSISMVLPSLVNLPGSQQVMNTCPSVIWFSTKSCRPASSSDKTSSNNSTGISPDSLCISSR